MTERSARACCHALQRGPGSNLEIFDCNSADAKIKMGPYSICARAAQPKVLSGHGWISTCSKFVLRTPAAKTSSSSPKEGTVSPTSRIPVDGTEASRLLCATGGHGPPYRLNAWNVIENFHIIPFMYVAD